MVGSRRLLKNSVANLVRAASAGLAAVVLPAVLVRALPEAMYSAWALVLQIAAYVAMLDLGLQVGIGRFIARETARGNDEERDQFFFGGALLLGACAVAALAATCLLAWCLPSLFPRITPGLVSACRIAVLLIGGSCAVSLPGSAIAATFIGLERYEVPALVLGAGRLIQVLATSAVALASHDLVRAAEAYALANLLMQLAYLALLRRSLPSLRFGRHQFRREVIDELVRYCANLSVWNFSMFLVYGLDIAIVAELSFKAVAPYSICANLMAMLVGFIGSAFNVLIPRASALDGQGQRRAVGQLLISASKACTVMLLGLGSVVVIWAAPAFSAWIGPAMAAPAMRFFWVLLAANGLRLLLTPYSTMLMGTGEHKWGIVATLAEGVSNLVASITLGSMFGPIGVAYGTLIGAGVGVTTTILFTFPRAVRIECSRGEFLGMGLFRPASCFFPLALGLFWRLLNPSLISAGASILGLAVTALLLTQLQPSPGWLKNRLAGASTK